MLSRTLRIFISSASGVANKARLIPKKQNFPAFFTIIQSRSYSNIDEFNKKKSSYSFGVEVNEESELEDEKRFPELHNMDRSSPEYKERLSKLLSEEQEHLRAQYKKEETRERIKALIFGFLALAAIALAHNVIINYEYYKKWALHSYNYGKLDEKRHTDLANPKINRNKQANMVNSTTEGIETTDFAAVKHSNSTPGLYLFGGDHSKARLPLRVPFFDDIFIKDVQVDDDIVSVLTESNDLYQIPLKGPKDTNLEAPIKAPKLPCKAISTRISNNYIYVLGQNGKLYYTLRVDARKEVPFTGFSYRNYLGLQSQSNTYGVLETSEFDSGEKITDVATGENHMLILTSKGRLFTAALADGLNFGQFGLPKFSPYGSRYEQAVIQTEKQKTDQKGSNAVSTDSSSTNSLIPLNTAFPLVGLNNEVVRAPSGPVLRRRVFTHIAAGKYHNIVADLSGNVWSWGRNAFGECGSEVSYKTDVQGVPQIVLLASNFHRSTNHVMESSKDPEKWHIDGLFAADEASFVKARYNNNQDVIFSFGNGMKGQLANNWYLQVCLTPQALKGLLNLSQFDEKLDRTTLVGVRDISVGGEHGFITLDVDDVLAFGDNEKGQLGTGKLARCSKPTQIPRLMEPEEVEGDTPRENVTKRIQDGNERLQMVQREDWEQKIVAGGKVSAIYYKKCK